jgi:hypothetical protein
MPTPKNVLTGAVSTLNENMLVADGMRNFCTMTLISGEAQGKIERWYQTLKNRILLEKGLLTWR